MLKNFFKTTFRNFWRNKTYSFLNIFGLAIGIACAGFIFLWIEDEVNFDSSYPKKDRLFEVVNSFINEGKTNVVRASSGPWANAMKTKIPGVVNACRMKQYTYLLNYNDKAIYGTCALTDPSFFSMFNMQFAQGNGKIAFKELYSVVITEEMAKKLFGTVANAKGKTVKLSNDRMGNDMSYLVSGVIKDLPNNSTLQFDCLIPFEHFVKKRSASINNWNTGYLDTYVELSPSANVAEINKQLDALIQANTPEAGAHPFLFSMNDWHLRAGFQDGKQTGGRIVYVRMFGFIAWIILFIACINFMNMATARSEKRAMEVGVRKVMGADRYMLFIQFIGEAICMALLAVLTGLAIINLLLPLFNILVEKQLTLDLDKPLHLFSLLAVAILCGLIAGSYPSFYLSSFKPVSVLKGFKARTGSATWIRKGLVVFQFSISIVLIIGSIVIYRQIQYVKHRDLGYNKDNLVQMDLYGDIKKHFTSVKQDLLNTGVVENAGMCSNEMLYEGNNRPNFFWQGKDPSREVVISFRDITPGFVATWALRLIEGRDFYSNGEADSSNVIITESLAKLMGEGSALGKTIQDGSKTYHVTGVVKDFIYGKMYASNSDPVIFFCKPANTEQIIIRIKATVHPQDALEKIAAVMKKNNPAYPFVYNFVDEQVNMFYKSEILIGKLSGIFATLAIIISCLGLFGLATYTAERRAKEISLRKVLGASIASVTGLLSKDFLQLIIISFFVAFPVAWWIMNNWLQNYQYRIEISWWIFLLAASLTILIALITISFQAIKAAIANPVKSLRME